MTCGNQVQQNIYFNTAIIIIIIIDVMIYERAILATEQDYFCWTAITQIKRIKNNCYKQYFGYQLKNIYLTDKFTK